MRWLRRMYMAVAVTAVVAVLATPASAQSQVTYALAGVEIAFTPQQGTFVGIAFGPDDVGTWGATVVHQPLDDNVPITGGTFALDGQTRNLAGVISDGDIVRLGGSCRKETFNVSGHVLLYQDGVATGDFGDFEVTLTHYGRRLSGGSCVIFFATIEGLITFTQAP